MSFKLDRLSHDALRLGRCKDDVAEDTRMTDFAEP